LLHVSVAKDASIKLRLAHPLPAVNADATQLRQILMNLVINASDAIGSRPGAIEIRTGVVEVDTAYLATTHLAPNLPGGRYVYLEVSDTGSGMDAETLKRIFDPFFTTKFTGRGLGLAAVLGIVRGHLGALNVSSEPGRGTTFTLLLPEVEGHADDLVAPAPPRSAWRGSGRVLIIDDEEAVRRAAAQMLKSIGFESVAAVDGRQGLDLFAAHPDAFQAILLDLTMPRLDGAKTFDQLNRLTRKVPIVVMSGFSEQEAMSQFDPGEIAGFLQKPFKPEELQAILQRAFECGQVRLSEGTCRMP
jgi:CheY-like chemotaxis protein